MCTPLVTYETPPTYFSTGKITYAFQVTLKRSKPLSSAARKMQISHDWSLGSFSRAVPGAEPETWDGSPLHVGRVMCSIVHHLHDVSRRLCP